MYDDARDLKPLASNLAALQDVAMAAQIGVRRIQHRVFRHAPTSVVEPFAASAHPGRQRSPGSSKHPASIAIHQKARLASGTFEPQSGRPLSGVATRPRRRGYARHVPGPEHGLIAEILLGSRRRSLPETADRQRQVTPARRSTCSKKVSCWAPWSRIIVVGSPIDRDPPGSVTAAIGADLHAR